MFISGQSHKEYYKKAKQTMNHRLTFPSSFVWGVATSSYQIEGATTKDGRGPSIWDTFCATPGKISDQTNGAIACDHYHLWEQDLDLIQSLGFKAYRFSVAWPRILPTGTSTVNQKGLDFYDRLVDGLLERDIQPFCTLYHWDLPQTLEDQGGWVSREVVEAFVQYADIVTRRLGDRVTAYATLNEPWCSAYLGYTQGEHAPGYTDTAMGLQAAHHLLLAHGAALPVMRANAPNAQHGIVVNLTPMYPHSDSAEDVALAQQINGFVNRWYLDPLFLGNYPEEAWEAYGEHVPQTQDGDLAIMSAPLDFLGVNYYSRGLVAYDESEPWPHAQHIKLEDAEYTDMGWEVFPEGLTNLLVQIHNDYILPPIYITENGAAYPDELNDDQVHDQARTHYYETHLQAVQNAMQQGVDVRGYFAWSLMDNFEWAFGYTKRFGIVYVDYETQARIPKDSAKWFKELLKT
ncbi:MAG: beta-glucosidase [Chloroflexi bacterium AL-W]|nr:beta-glucosidase [Chloroflexi bacterium AL-N1]NOK70535.1 beta-glucosidase [Chloroflexi bacterium AL-N10]NOK78106.1 beta-glucosidase [Chloroflexi bacterium AL-N5]NOK85205.1 beta-glucosidase [Chloroflexi bacterium AL-W]NOK91970.1 beta-glucosidase [Chloroflexi bacterium AL-N15]